MRKCWVVAIAVANLASSALAQVQDKQSVLGEHLARDIDRRDGRVSDVALLDYLQRVGTRITRAIGARPVEIRVTRSSEKSAILLPHGVLYFSSGLLARIESESELAGLLAHELAHSQHGSRVAPIGAVGILLPPCILASQLTPIRWAEQMHDEEMRATAEAIRYMKVAGYDPVSVLEIFSKLSSDNSTWGKAIRSEDLLDLRATLESETPDNSGYILNSSDFIEQHARVALALGHVPRSRPSLYLPH